DPELDSSGRRTVRPRHWLRGPHDEAHLPANRLQIGGSPHHCPAPESAEGLQHRHRGHHPLPHRPRAPSSRRPPAPPYQRRYTTPTTHVTANHGIPQARVRIAANASFSCVQHNSTLIGIPSDWAPSFPLQARDSVYRDDAAAWTAIQSDPGLAIIDGSVVPND